jgi:hypothetical protein
MYRQPAIGAIHTPMMPSADGDGGASFGDAVRRPVTLAPARLPSLDGWWFSCTIRHFGGPLWITHAAERVHGGMAARRSRVPGWRRGRAWPHVAQEGGPNARLSHNLPGRLLRETL